MCYNRWNGHNGLGGVAKTHRWIESKWNGVANGMPSRCNRYRIPLDRQPPRNERRDAIRESMEFGHPLVTLWSELFYFGRGYAPPRSRVLFVFQPLWRLPSTFVYYPFVRKFYSFLLYDFDDVEEICINSKIIWRNGKFKRLGHCVGLDHRRIRAMRDF